MHFTSGQTEAFVHVIRTTQNTFPRCHQMHAFDRPVRGIRSQECSYEQMPLTRSSNACISRQDKQRHSCMSFAPHETHFRDVIKCMHLTDLSGVSVHKNVLINRCPRPGHQIHAFHVRTNRGIRACHSHHTKHMSEMSSNACI